MSDQYPPPRRLTRSTTDRYVGGVCGGLAQYLNVDATIVRLVTVVIGLTLGFPLVLYVIALLVIPEEDRPRPPSPTVYPPVYPPHSALRPPAPPAGPGDPIWGREGAPWEQPQNAPQHRPEPGPWTDRT
jgi:phage shock protein PspC (stress-responsive transcriptional regulator)